MRRQTVRARLPTPTADSLVLVHFMKLDVVWGTDRHLAVEGARVVPGPSR